ncbi:MAG: hypothetical protein JSV24_08195 [Bacteroidales bacterium]|nr:MAG: hypothetical protein JSV24_08195 [Bacteroidales bacterium]
MLKKSGNPVFLTGTIKSGNSGYTKGMNIHYSGRYTFILIFLLSILTSCKEADEYFKDPETEPVIHAIKAATAIGYSASAAMAVMTGEQLPGVYATKSCSSFPCASLVYISINSGNYFPYSDDRNGQIIIAGLWPSAEEAILTMFIYDLDISTPGFTLKNVRTFPVTRKDGELMAVFAGMDINIGPNPLLPLELVLTEGEINFELSRLETETPEDIYVAVDQHAYIIEIDQKDTPANLLDDVYTITGGGQLIEVVDDRAGIIQQALMAVEMNPDCLFNPRNGYALIKTTGTGDNTLPELGTAILEFHTACDGTADITVATGVYIRSNGKSIPLGLME